jgi:mRNA interferase RelE/StbE
MQIERTTRFVRSYSRLTPEERQQVDTRLALLAENPQHPSLQARKWSGDIWYGRASRDLRFFYEVKSDICSLLDVGHHDIERSK